MADISVSMGVTGKDVVQGAFKDVAASAEQMGQALMEHTKKLAEAYLGYQSVVQVIGTFKAALEVGDKLADLSDQTGISAGKLAILQRAFENSGLQADELGKYVNKMQKFIESAGDTGSAAAEKLARIGLTAEDLKKLAPDEQFATIAKAIAGISDPGEKAAESMEIFGKAGGKTLALFNDFDQTMAEAQMQVGGLADIMDAKSGTFNKVNDALGAIGKKTTEFAVGLLDDALPALDTLTTYLKNFDASAFGRQFSETLVRGIDFALGIFREPGDTFLAFGDALVVAIKSATNVLLNGLVYAWDFGVKYFQTIAESGIGTYLKNLVLIAVGGALDVLLPKLNEQFVDLLKIVQMFGGQAGIAATAFLAAHEATKSIVDAFQTKLAPVVDETDKAFARAYENTKYINRDFTDAAGSAQQMRDHAEAVRASGEAFRSEIQTSNELLSAMPKFVDQMVGGAKTFRDFMADADNSQKGVFSQQTPGSNPFLTTGQNAAGLGDLYGPKKETKAISLPSSGGSASARSTGSGPAMPSIPASFLGSNPYDQSVKSAQQSGDYLNYLSAKASQEAYSAARQEELNYQAGQARAAQDYTGDSRTSFADLFAQVEEKYRNMGYNKSESADFANRELKDYINKTPGPSGDKNGPGGAGGGSGPQKSPEAQAADMVTKIYEYLKNTVRLDEKLPLMALS
jgi:methyl-accepting chemotaxis protein